MNSFENIAQINNIQLQKLPQLARVCDAASMFNEKKLNWLKIIGITLIVLTSYELISIIADYSSGKLEFWPFGAEIGAGLIIWLGIFLIKKGNKQKNKI